MAAGWKRRLTLEELVPLLLVTVLLVTVPLVSGCASASAGARLEVAGPQARVRQRVERTMRELGFRTSSENTYARTDPFRLREDGDYVFAFGSGDEHVEYGVSCGRPRGARDGEDVSLLSIITFRTREHGDAVTVQLDPTFQLRASDGSIASCRPDSGLARRLARIATGED